MSVKSGAGASVASGADFQSRVAAYTLISRICGHPLDFLDYHEVESISFETAEAVDDLNIRLSDAEVVYVQAKSTLDFSLALESPLYSVLRQFAAQYRRTSGRECRYILAVGSESSRRISRDFRLALEAYRPGDEHSFRRDQPKALVQIADDVFTTLLAALVELGQSEAEFHVRKLLRRSYVVPFDLDEGTAFERSVPLLLRSRGFSSPDLVWGKLIADCLDHARHRRTVDAAHVAKTYERFLKAAEVSERENWFECQIEGSGFSAGKEVVLGFVEADKSKTFDVGSALLAETIRFDDNCEQRVRFRNGRCYLAAGSLVVRLLARSATYTGMIRLLDEVKDRLNDIKLYRIPMCPDVNPESGLCVEHHKQLLEAAFRANPEKMRCLHCGKPISNASCNLVETRMFAELKVGLVHPACRKSEDRVIGFIQAPFFEKHNFLRNFDVKLWTSSILGGQNVFGARRILSPGVVVWNGEPNGAPGDWVIEYSLSNGDCAVVRKRGKVHRFSRPDAEKLCDQLAHSWESSARLGDPQCLSEQSAAYGTKSFLLKHLKKPQKLLEISSPRVTRFQQYMAERYEQCKNWFAPLLFLRSQEDGSIFEIGGHIPLLTNPLDLGMYLENWGEVMDLPDYEVVILSTDEEFDDFAAGAQRNGLRLIVDPLVDPSGHPQFLSGTPIQYSDELVSTVNCDSESI